MQPASYTKLDDVRALSDEILVAATERFASNAKVVYFVQAGEHGPIKIGYCQRFANVRKRMAELQTGCPWPLKIRRVIRADRGMWDEKDIHEQFARYRLAGEWFEAAPVVAEAAGGVVGTNQTFVDMLDAAYNAGRYQATLDAKHDWVECVSKHLKEVIDSWSETAAPHDDSAPRDWEAIRRARVDDLLGREAA